MQTAHFASVHGAFLNLFGSGVLLIGKSGVGKSETALALIDRGHKLIADDMVEFTAMPDQTLIGRCPELLKNVLEVRELGVLNITHLFGEQAVIDECPLTCVIQLNATGTPQHILDADGTVYPLLGIEIPLFNLTASTQRPLALLIETIVRNHQQQQLGRHAAQQFIASHQTLLETPA